MAAPGPLKKRKDPWMQVELGARARAQIKQVIDAVKQYTGFQEETRDQSSSRHKDLAQMQARSDAPSSGIPAYANWLDEIHHRVDEYTRIRILETLGTDSNGVDYRQLEITMTRHMDAGGKTGDNVMTVVDLSGSPSAAPAAPAAPVVPSVTIHIRQYPNTPWGVMWSGYGPDAGRLEGAGASKDSSSSSSSSCKDYGIQLRW